jgi:hypothetical protein
MTGDRALLRTYLRARRRRRQALTLLNGCFDGLWLGLLDERATARLDEDFYRRGADVDGGRSFNYRDDAYNLTGLREWEAAAVYRYIPPLSRIVVTGAGSGREVIGLLERGYDAVGYEPNRALVKAGSELLARVGRPGRLHACARDVFPDDTPECDAVIVGWGSYMLIPTRARRVEFLREARRVLPDGAPLLCSFFTRTPGARYYDVVARTANLLRRARRRPRVEVGDVLGQNLIHSFTQREIESELVAGGFRPVEYKEHPYAHAVAVAEP